MSAKTMEQLSGLFPWNTGGEDAANSEMDTSQLTERAISPANLYLAITSSLFANVEQLILATLAKSQELNSDSLRKLHSIFHTVSSIELLLRRNAENSEEATDLSDNQLEFIKSNLKIGAGLPTNQFGEAADVSELAIYGHDLQTVLTELIGYLDIALEIDFPKEQLKSLLQSIVKKLTKLRTEFFNPVVSQTFLTFEKNCLKSLRDYRGEGNLLIDSHDTVVISRLEPKGIILAGSVFAIRLMANILSNAMRAYDSVNALERPVRISSRVVLEADGTKRYVLTVEDEGPGFPNAQSVNGSAGDFIPFRPSGETKWQGRVKGTGTGLKGLLVTLQPLIDAGEAGYEMGTYFKGGLVGGARTTFWWKIHEEPLQDSATP